MAGAQGKRAGSGVTRVAVAAVLVLSLNALSSGAPPSVAATIAIPPESSVLDTLRPGHPRLLLTPDDVTTLKVRITTDPALGAMYAKVRQRATDLLGIAPVVYDTSATDGLLEVSREAVRRMQVLGLVWLVEGDVQVAERGRQELLAVSAFPDWNPVHFLDTAEMTHAVAIGLDWLYDALDPVDRTIFTDAIITKGLIPARDSYNGSASLYVSWWTKVDHNWNQVVNGGVTLGALAIADVDPALAAYVLHEALTRLPIALAHYAPDGGWPEGVSYWLYATSYTVYALTALRSALRSDFGLSDVAGFDRTGEVPIHLSGPSGQRANFADDGDPRPAPAAPFEFWLAERFGRPAFRDYQLQHADPSALDVVWYRPATGPPEAVPLDRVFTGIDVAALRGPRDDPDATWVAFKGGFPQFNHNQLDLGSFMLDANGERWATDLGRDNYGLPGYFLNWLKGERWTYYRNRAEGHNTLVIDPGAAADQWPKAMAHIVRSESSSADSFAIVDLSSAYPGHTVERGVRLLDRERVLVQDELHLATPAEVWWFMHTRAEVELRDGDRTAVLTLNGRSLRTRLVSPAGATFGVMDAAPLPSSPDPEGQTPNVGVRKLFIHRPGVLAETIVVSFEPDATVAPPAVEVEPLAQWSTTPPPEPTPTSTSTSVAPSASSSAPAPAPAPAPVPVPTTNAVAPGLALPSSRPARPVAARPAFTG